MQIELTHCKNKIRHSISMYSFTYNGFHHWGFFFQEQVKTMTHQLSIAKETEDSYKKSLKTLEEVTAKMEREKLQQQTHEVKTSN